MNGKAVETVVAFVTPSVSVLPVLSKELAENGFDVVTFVAFVGPSVRVAPTLSNESEIRIPDTCKLLVTDAVVA